MEYRTIVVGKGGGGSSAVAQHTPHEAPDSLRSVTVMKRIDVLSEGPIVGVVGGLRGVKIQDTPIQAADGTYNFRNIDISFRNGVQNQSAVPGFPTVESDYSDGRELKHIGGNGALTITVANKSIDRLRVTIGVGSLTHTEANGDMGGSNVELKFSVAPNGKPFVDVISDYISGKATSHYQRSYDVPLRKFGEGPWTVRVERMTPDSDTLSTTSKTFIDFYTEVTDAKLRYPNTAYCAIRADAQSFTSEPEVSYVVQGLYVRVPSNYTPRDPVKGTPAKYSGTWDGTFKMAWTDNPAWCFYDFCTEDRYGAGAYLEDSLDKWEMYTAGQYCDVLVPDGFGGWEPRFTCNLRLETQEEAFKVINNFASIFRAITYWATGTVGIAQDRPSDPIALFTESNVHKEGFVYSTSALRAQHNTVIVAWNDPSDGCRVKYEYVQDDESVRLTGRIIKTDIAAFGCTSRGEAHRWGRWLLYTERYGDRVVAFKTGLRGILIRPGSEIRVQDASRVGQRLGGRLVETLVSTTTTLHLDTMVEIAVGKKYTLMVTMPDGSVQERTVRNTPGSYTSLVCDEFTTAPGALTDWILSAEDLVPQIFRVLAITEEDFDSYSVMAVSHNPSKYAHIEEGLELTTVPDGTIGNEDKDLAVVENLTASEYLVVSGPDVKINISVNWSPVRLARGYRMSWRRDEGAWTNMPTTSESHCEITNALPGTYVIRVSAIKQSGLSTPAATIMYKTKGKAGIPPGDVHNFIAKPNKFTVELSWDAVLDLDLSGYEIRMGTTWDSGQVVFKGNATKFTWQRPDSGVYTMWIKAMDTSQNYSANAARAQLAVNPSDDYITPPEKRDIKTYLLRHQDDFNTPSIGLKDQAASAGVVKEKDDFTTELTAFTTYLDGLFDEDGSDAWANGDWSSYVRTVNLADGKNSGGSAALRTSMAKLDAARSNLASAISAAMQSDLDSVFSDDVLSRPEKRSIEMLYGAITTERASLVSLADVWKIVAEKKSYEDAIAALATFLSALRPVWNDMATDTPLGTGGGAQLSMLFKNVYAAKNFLVNAVDLRTHSNFDDLYSDDKLTPLEKPSLVEEVNNIIVERDASVTGLVALAASFKVSSTGYVAAIKSLTDHLLLIPGWDTIPGDVVDLGSGGGAHLRSKVRAVHSERDALRGKITNAAKDQVDAIASDDVLSRAEKPLFSSTVSMLRSERAGIEKQCADWSITPECKAYTDKLDALKTYLDALTPAWEDFSQDTPLGIGGGLALRDAMNAVYTTRAAVQSKIQQRVLGTFNDIFDDDKLTPIEKPGLVDRYKRLVAEQTDPTLGLDAQARDFGVDADAYDDAIAAVTARLALPLMTGWDIIPGATIDMGAGGGKVLRNLFSEADKQRDLLVGSISKASASIIESITNDDTLSRTEKRPFTLIYTALVAESQSLSTKADSWTVVAEKTVYTDALKVLTDMVGALTPPYNDVTKDTPLGIGGGKKMRDAFTALYAAKDNLIKAIETKSKLALDDLLSDDKLSPNEKPRLVDEYQRILVEQTLLDAQADKGLCNRTPYDSAITALTNKLNSYVGWNNYGTTTDLGTGGGATLRAAFSLVYDEREALKNAITNGIRTTIDDILSDDVIAPSEKPALVQLYDDIIARQTTAKTGLDALADLMGVSRVSYDTSINELKTYLATAPLTGWNVIPGVSVKLGSGGGVTFRAKWRAVTTAADMLWGAILAADSNDDILGVPRKLAFMQAWGEITATQSQLAIKASQYGVSTTALDNSIKAVSPTFFNTRNTPVVWSDLSGPTALGTGGGAALRSLLNTINNEIEKLRASIAAGAAAAAIASGATDAMLRSDFIDPVSGKIRWTMVSAAIKTIYAHQLYIANWDNLIPNPMSEDPTPSGGWPTDALEGRGVSLGDAMVGNYCRYVPAYNELVLTAQIGCGPGDQFIFRGYGKNMSGGSGAMCKITFSTGAAYYVQVSGSSYGIAETTSGPAPAGTTYVTFSIYGGTGGAKFDNLYARRMNDASMIVDGSITAQKLQAQLILGTIIQTSNFQKDAQTGRVISGARLSGLPGEPPIQAGPDGIQVGAYTLGEPVFRALVALEGTDPSNPAFQVWYRGNNNPFVRKGTPNIDCLTIMSKLCHYAAGDVTYGGWEYTIQPTRADDNFDAMCHIEVGYFKPGANNTTPYRLCRYPVGSQPHASLNYADEANRFGASIFETFRGTYYNTHGMNFYLRVRLVNCYGPSDAKWFYPITEEEGMLTGYATAPGGGGGLSGGGSTGGGSTGGGCPSPDEPILLADQTEIRAGDLKPGMKVWSAHEITGEWGEFTVTAVRVSTNIRYVLLLEDGRELLAAWNHWMFLPDGSMMPISKLRPGTVLTGINPGVVDSVWRKDVGEVVEINIEDGHTYQNRGLTSHNLFKIPMSDVT